MLEIQLDLPDYEGTITMAPGESLAKLEEHLMGIYGREKKILFCLQPYKEDNRYCLMLHKIPLSPPVETLFVEFIDKAEYDRSIIKIWVRNSKNVQQRIDVAQGALMEEVDLLYRSYTGQTNSQFRYHLESDPARKQLPLEHQISLIPRQADDLVLMAVPRAVIVEIIESGNQLARVEMPLETLNNTRARNLYQGCWQALELPKYSDLTDYWYEYKTSKVHRESPVAAAIGETVKLCIQHYIDPRLVVLRDTEGNEIARKLFEAKKLDMRKLWEVYVQVTSNRGIHTRYEISTPQGVLTNNSYLKVKQFESQIVMVVSLGPADDPAPEKKLNSFLQNYSECSNPNSSEVRSLDPISGKALWSQGFQPIKVVEDPPNEHERIKRQLKKLLLEETSDNTVQTNSRLRELSREFLALDL